MLAKLKKDGFECTDEANPNIKSVVCSHYADSPIMLVALSGDDQDTLGRVSLDIQSTTRAAIARAMSDYLISAFAGDDAAALAANALATVSLNMDAPRWDTWFESLSARIATTGSPL